MPKGITHPAEVVSRALQLSAEGMSDYRVADELSLPRATVQHWRLSGAPHRRPVPPLTRPLDDRAYSYLLGLYLGDGHLVRERRVWRLTISPDAAYPGIVSDCRAAIATTLARQARARYRGGAMLVTTHRKGLAVLFPQHGPGRKHLRPIWLADWQRKITERYPHGLLRGLIHSDGSRCINRFSTKLPSGRIKEYAYPRYFFTNYSEDIQRIFCDHCELLGIRWTQSNPRNISVSHRDSVAMLDEFVGPKA